MRHKAEKERQHIDLEAMHRKMYLLPEAARLLRINTTTLKRWLEGDERRPPVIRPHATGSDAVTWGEFVEAGFLREYRRSLSLQRIRPAMAKLRQKFDVPYPLAHYKPFIGPGRHLTLEAQQEAQVPRDLFIVYWEIATGQLVLADPTLDYIEKVDFALGGTRWAERIHPAGRESPVVIDPDYSFGAPTIRGIKTYIITELVEAGESLEVVAEGYSLSVTDIEAAVAYEGEAAA